MGFDSIKACRVFQRGILSFLLVLGLCQNTWSQQPRVLLRIDDIGMSHSVNMAAKELAETGMPFSTSVMFACPWYLEAVDILKDYPQVSVGIHLTLNSEWKYLKWGPVLGKEAVPSLVDSNGYFFATHAQFDAHDVKPAEVERELRTQIDRALRSGLDIDYVDYHMGTAVKTPELRAVVEKLAEEYGLGISRYLNEAYNTLFPDPIASKVDSLLAILETADPYRPNLVVMHLGLPNPEMNALFDMDNPLMTSGDGLSLVSKHRHAELKALVSDEFKTALQARQIKLITYRDLIAETGLSNMKRPD